MKVFVVRHVKAGDRSGWDGPDHQRPISKAGTRQANALADRLAGERISQLMASPSRRCIQSLEPLADRLGLRVQAEERLNEGSSIEHTLAVAGEVADGAVLCSHGDVIPDLIAALVRRGMELTTEPDWRKATLWTLSGTLEARQDSGGERLFTHAGVEAPPPSAPNVNGDGGTKTKTKTNNTAKTKTNNTANTNAKTKTKTKAKV